MEVLIFYLISTINFKIAKEKKGFLKLFPKNLTCFADEEAE